MQIMFNALIVLATINLAIFAYEQGRKIYKRYQDRKDAEAFLRWANKRLQEAEEEIRARSKEEHHE